MKKLYTAMIASLAGVLLVAAGCASYSAFQTDAMKNRAPTCEDLHIHYAEWDYRDNFGNVYHTVGRCVRGMKHGEFSYMMNGKLIAKTKFIRNAESKTACYVGKKHASQLTFCLDEAVQMTGRRLDSQPAQTAQTAQQPANAAAQQVQLGTVMMVPAQEGQAGAVLMAPVQQGENGGVLLVPAQPGQEGAVWMVPVTQPVPQGTAP